MRDNKMSTGALVASIVSGVYSIITLVEFLLIISVLGEVSGAVGALILSLLLLILVCVTFALNIVLTNKVFKNSSNLYSFAVVPLILNFTLVICNIITCILNPTVASIIVNILLAFFSIISLCFIIDAIFDYKKSVSSQALNDNDDKSNNENYEKKTKNETFDIFVNKLNKLNELKENNLITEDEYNKVKNKLLEDI